VVIGGVLVLVGIVAGDPPALVGTIPVPAPPPITMVGDPPAPPLDVVTPATPATPGAVDTGIIPPSELVGRVPGAPADGSGVVMLAPAVCTSCPAAPLAPATLPFESPPALHAPTKPHAIAAAPIHAASG
jgi:hypothetical protein